MANEGRDPETPMFVSVVSGAITIEGDVQALPGDTHDMDTGAGEDNHGGVFIALPGAGGHRVGGTDTDPLTVRQKTGDQWGVLAAQSGTWTVDTNLDGYLASIQAAAEAIQAQTDTLEALLGQVVGHVDGAEALLTAIRDNGDQVETLLQNLSNVMLDVWDDPADSLRVKVTSSTLPAGAATETTLAAVLTAVDQLEGYLATLVTQTDTIESLLTSIRDNGDTVEASLSTLITQTDNVEAGIGAPTDAAATGDGSTIAILKRLRAIFTDVWDSVSQRLRTRSALDPPSTVSGRVHVNKVLGNQTASGTVHTVTAGKTLYVHTLVVTAVNTNTGSEGDLRLRDGVAGTDKLPFLMAQAGLAAGLSSVPLQAGNIYLMEPLKFTTSVRMEILLGTVRYSIGLVGYEE